ncbi:MAG: hypothetical protein FJ004_05415 [Chloroflexi bacterium]|nr:hypothetical protein [Chloroflexota bacterium]
MTNDNGKQEQIRIEQYRQAREDWRHYDTLIWATPSVIVGISGAILGLSYNYLNDGFELVIRVVLLVALAVWIFTLLIALSKHRFFQLGRTDFFHQLEPAQMKTPMQTREQNTKPKNWCERQTAFTWLFVSVLITLIIALLACIHSVILVTANMACRLLTVFSC